MITSESPLAASIIVPSYRGADRLPALFDALAAQDADGPSFETIVVIDGVDDGSVALVESESRFPVRHILFPENRGRVAALNTGFREARGDILIRCDDDLVVPRGYVRAHADAHAGTESVGAVGPTRDVHLDSSYARAYGEDAAERSLQHSLSRPSGERWKLWAASCSITRETWERIGPYDARYQGYGWEDVDYGYRIHAAGLPIVVVGEALAEHRGPARSAQMRALKAYESGGARSTFQRLHPEAPVEQPSAGGGPWGVAVGIAARGIRSPRTASRLGGFVDGVLLLTPLPIGRKLVALTVEGAGLAGSRARATAEARR